MAVSNVQVVINNGRAGKKENKKQRKGKDWSYRYLSIMKSVLDFPCAGN